MKHRIKLRKLNRTSSHRKSLLRNMSVALLQHERIVTTLPKAKALRPFLERLVTKARNGANSLHVRRQLLSILSDEVIVKKLLEVYSERFAVRPGGYLRILKNGFRYGDAAPMAIIEFVDYDQQKSA